MHVIIGTMMLKNIKIYLILILKIRFKNHYWKYRPQSISFLLKKNYKFDAHIVQMEITSKNLIPCLCFSELKNN